MPAFLQNLLSSLDVLKYIDYQILLESFKSPYIIAVLVGGAFFMFFAYASFRRHMFHTSMSGAGMGFFVGIILTLGLEGVAVYKFLGVKFVTSILQTRTTSTSQTVLGETTTSLDKYLSNLSPAEAKSIKLSICQDLLKEIN